MPEAVDLRLPGKEASKRPGLPCPNLEALKSDGRHGADTTQKMAPTAEAWCRPWFGSIGGGYSGFEASRPALDELKKAVRAGEVRQVMVFGLDRLGRSLRDLLVLFDELAAAGCVVISLREAIDLSTPTGRLMLHLAAGRGRPPSAAKNSVAGVGGGGGRAVNVVTLGGPPRIGGRSSGTMAPKWW